VATSRLPLPCTPKAAPMFYVMLTRIFLHSWKRWCSGCTTTWTHRVDIAFGNGRVRHSATTVPACKQECLVTPACNGFDFNPANQPTGQCWLTGAWAGQQTGRYSQGVTHYNVIATIAGTYTHVSAQLKTVVVQAAPRSGRLNRTQSAEMEATDFMRPQSRHVGKNAWALQTVMASILIAQIRSLLSVGWLDRGLDRLR